jgi:hypothetical protein
MQGSKPTVPRRDDRAEPDDDDESVGSSRIDVVSVDSVRGGPDTASSGMVALRRELAKLNQQAAAVEKSLEDQRRERSDSLERLERERQHVLALETRVLNAEAESASLRKSHGVALSEMEALHDATLVELRKAREERAASEKAAEEARAQANEIAAKNAKDAADAQASKDEAAKRATELSKAKDDLTKARGDLAKANADLAKAKDDVAKASADHAKTKDEHEREHTTARERIAALERGADEANALSQRRQSELDAARETEVRLSGEAQAARTNAELLATQLDAARRSEEHLGHQLETALARAAAAESQALDISLSHASLEGSMRTLRDEITAAFERVGRPVVAAAPVSASRMPEAATRSIPPPPGYEPKDPKFSSED